MQITIKNVHYSTNSIASLTANQLKNMFYRVRFVKLELHLLRLLEYAERINKNDLD